VRPSLVVLSPRNHRDSEVVLLAFKSYFDGSTNKESTFMTLACVAGDENVGER
jgi:hypothetical protein